MDVSNIKAEFNRQNCGTGRKRQGRKGEGGAGGATPPPNSSPTPISQSSFPPGCDCSHRARCKPQVVTVSKDITERCTGQQCSKEACKASRLLIVGHGSAAAAKRITKACWAERAHRSSSKRGRQSALKLPHLQHHPHAPHLCTSQLLHFAITSKYSLH